MTFNKGQELLVTGFGQIYLQKPNKTVVKILYIEEQLPYHITEVFWSNGTRSTEPLDKAEFKLKPTKPYKKEDWL